MYSTLAYTQSDSVDIILKSNVNDTIKIINIHNYLNNKLSEYDILIKGGNAMLSLAEKTNWERGKLYGYYNLGYGLDGNQNFEEAIKCYYAGLPIAEKLNENKIKYDLYNFLGIISSIQDQHKKAIYFFKKSLDVCIKMNNKSAVGVIKNNIGIEYNELKQHNIALVYFKEALPVFLENRLNGKIELFGNLLDTYISLNDEKSANDYYNKLKTEISLPYYKSNLMYIESAYLSFGHYNIYKKNYKQAIKDLDSCIIILEKKPFFDQLKKAYNYRSMAYEELGNHKEALRNYKLYIANRDEIMNGELIRKSLEEENKFKNIKTQLELEKNKKDNEIKRLKIKRTSVVLISLSSVVIILILSLFFVFRLLKLRRNDLTLLKNKNEIIEEKQKEILSSIRYAKRIQDSFLASEKYIQKKLHNLMGK
jgi:tetratricopeptide (TPR) repeat protein